MKAISSGSPEYGAGIPSLASPMSGVSAATVSSPSAKARRSGAFRCASWLIRRAISRNSSRGRRTSCSNDSGISWRQLGNWPSISRDESATPATWNTAWFRGSAISTSSAASAPMIRGELAQRPRRDVRLERLRDRRLELGVLDAEPVGVGGDHGQRVALGLHQDAGEDRAHLVARGGAGDELDRLAPAAPPAAHGLALELGEAREILGRQGAEVEARAAGGDLDVALLGAQLERHLARRQAADDVGEQAARAAARCPSCSTLASASVLVSASSMSVARRVSDAVAGDDAGCRRARQGAAGRDGAADELQRGGEGVAGNGKLHRSRSSSYLDQMYLIRGWLWIGVGVRLNRRDRAVDQRLGRVDHAASRWTGSCRAGVSSPGWHGSVWMVAGVSEPGSSRPDDGADRVHDGGVVAVEAAGDLGERERGQFTGQVHGELTRLDDPRRARAARAGPRGSSRRRAQTASWIATSVGGLGRGCAAHRPRRAERPADDRR